MSDTHEYDNLLQSLKEAAVGLKTLSQRAANEYAPIVEHIMKTRSQDVADIERTLDGLLGFCGYDPALRQYRKLCRYYWDLNPANTAMAQRDSAEKVAGIFQMPSAMRAVQASTATIQRPSLPLWRADSHV